MATNSANDPQWVNPGWNCLSHTWCSPRRQVSHWPHAQTNGTVTRSPGFHLWTRDPTSAITPANSWPGTCGRRISGSCPIHPCQSLRHRPLAATSMTTPVSGQAGSSTVTTSGSCWTVSYTHLRAHETRHDLVCRLLLEKTKNYKGQIDDYKTQEQHYGKKKNTH